MFTPFKVQQRYFFIEDRPPFPTARIDITVYPRYDTRPLLSIAIVNWNTRDLLMQALNSIFASSLQTLDVIVVDNASMDGSADQVRKRFPQVRLIANSGNMGYAAGNNQAISVARGAYILLLNPDVILPPDALELALQFMEQRHDAGALGVRQIYPDGKLQHSVRGFPTPLSVLWELLGIARLFPESRFFGSYRMTWFAYDRIAEVDQPMGTFLLLSAKAVGDIGLLDEAFPIFFNEVDWCLRCKRAGWKIYFSPEPQIVHHGGASTVQVGAAMAWESRRGLLKFYSKHYTSLWLWPLRLLISVASWPYAWLQARRRSFERKRAA